VDDPDAQRIWHAQAETILTALGSLLAECRQGDVYQFPQHSPLVIIRRPDLLPRLLSDGPLYASTYEARRAASTMQANSLEWLRGTGASLIIESLRPGDGDTLRITSVGCGDGDLDCALLQGLFADNGATLKSHGWAGVDFVGLEPIAAHRARFETRVTALCSVGDLPQLGGGGGEQPTLAVNIQDAVFRPTGPHPKQSEVVLALHVLYYFDNKSEALQGLLEMIVEGGTVVVIQQLDQGVVSLQRELLPVLRGSTADLCTAQDIAAALQSPPLSASVTSVARHDVDASLSLELTPVNGSGGGQVDFANSTALAVASFCLEVDLTVADDMTRRRVASAWYREAGKLVAEGGRDDGERRLADGVACLVVK